jgi:hypothetical protein
MADHAEPRHTGQYQLSPSTPSSARLVGSGPALMRPSPVRVTSCHLASRASVRYSSRDHGSARARAASRPIRAAWAPSAGGSGNGPLALTSVFPCQHSAKPDRPFKTQDSDDPFSISGHNLHRRRPRAVCQHRLHIGTTSANQELTDRHRARGVILRRPPVR